MANHSVYPDGEGGWIVSRDDNPQQRSGHSTRSQAIAVARRRCGDTGGGQVSIHGHNGRVREKDTVRPVHGPRSLPC